MAFSDAEIQEIKYRLGYGGVTATASPYLDTAPAFEVVIQQNVNAYVEGQIRDTILPMLRQYDTDRYAARKRLKALELVGEVKLNNEETVQLGDEYLYWLRRLASAVRMPIARPPEGGQGGGGGHAVVLR